jgi:energy-coupling factor transporter ATP-binding protein EcfA2
MDFPISIWNRLVNRAPPGSSDLQLGHRVVEGEITAQKYTLPQLRRTEHIVVIGKTGTGKTSLIKSMLSSDIRQGHGFLVVDLHGDLTPFILERIAEQEQREQRDLSSRTIVLDPANPDASVGMNILGKSKTLGPLVSEVVAIFRRRWQLDHFGARTEELLRNTLWVLAESGLTLTEIAPFLTDLGFRAPLIEHSSNPEVKAYFRERYEQMSGAMQTVVREAILNKASAFTIDPAIRHIVGQQEALDLADVLDKGAWVILRLNKSELGENSETLAALILARFQNAVFVRRKRNVFTIYADEVQNLVGSGDTFEHLLSEARKFSVSVVTANQHLGQYSAQLRATLLSAGTTIFFRSSPEDSPFIARALDGGPALERRLKELPNRRFLIRSQGDHWSEVAASEIPRNTISTLGLVARSVARWARSRTAIEESIAARRGNAPRKDKLEEWQ